MHICVFCSSQQGIDPKYLNLAAEAGEGLAKRGHTLVSGGAVVSCMGEVARAVRRSGGRTIGVIPQALVDIEIADTASDELIVTGGMRERKGIMEARSDGFLVLPGGIGTMEELFEVWTGRLLGLHDKPMVLLDPWGDYEPLRALVTSMYDNGFTRAEVFDAVGWATSVSEALDLLARPARHLGPHVADVAESAPDQ